ncbi:VWA domain-containing protein [bacterium]|nr:VWA domain-containing protein [bacterium]MBU1994822.1 VWA domain-containing protein [bacterium]
MNFLHPEFLYYMLPPLFILFGLLLTQKETQAHFFSEEVMRKLRVSANTLTLRARNALFFLMGFLMILALSGPVINEGTIEVKAKSADIMIALDISDSMLAEDVYPNRLNHAKQKALELLKIAPNERIGVIAFAKNSYLVSPLSFDHSVVSFLLSQLNTSSITEKGTDFLSMLDVVNKSLDKASKKYLLILSDGGDKENFSDEIELAKKHGIVVFILGTGTKQGAPIKLENGNFITHNSKIIISKLNENIAEMATKTGGVYIQNTTSTQDIKTMLREIESISEQKELKSEEVQRYIPLFYYPLGLALFILLIATSSMSKRELVHLPFAFLLFALVFASPHAQAGLLDFIDLKEAKEAYEKQDYERASGIYEKHAQANNNAQSHYNAGNSFYKQKKYEEAVNSYQRAHFDDKAKKAINFANMGNAYAKQGKGENLQKAIESYEQSLKLQEDAPTRENLEEVKKLLEKQDTNEEKSDESKQNQDEQKEGEQKEKNQKNDENKDSKNADEKQKKSQDENTKQDKSQEQNSKEKQDRQKDKEQNSDEQQKSSKENNESKPEKEDLKQLKEDSEKDKDNKDASSPSLEDVAPAQMSDAEEKKWLDELNMQNSTYMYMLCDEKPKEENTNEKPW